MRLAPLIALALAAAASAQAPDTLDWRRYYPLAVGNAWEYHDAEMWGVQFRHTLIADTVVGGHVYFVRRTDHASLGSPAPSAIPHLDYVRYDEAGGGVVAVASLSDDGASVRRCTDADLFERDLRLAFGTRLACGGGAAGTDSLFVDGQYDTVWQPDVLSGTPAPVAVAAVKQFVASYLHVTTFVADVGPVRAGNLWGPSLHHAVIGGVAYGTPEMIIVEPGGPLSPLDAVVALPDDLTFTLANLTSAPVVLDSLAMRFGDGPEYRAWFFSSESGASAWLECSFFGGDPFPGLSGCSGPVTLAPGAVLRAQAFYERCSICRSGGASRGVSRDTLLVYSGGIAEPDIVLFDDSGYVGTEATPTPGALALTVGPNPLVGDGSVVVSTAEPLRAARVALLDALGRRVAVLHDGALPVGASRLGVPRDLPAGVYLVLADAEGRTATARFTVVR